MPEDGDAGVRPRFLDHPGRQREVVILHQHGWIGFVLRFLKQGVREAAVHRVIVFPILLAEQRAGVCDVAQRPQTFIRESEVESFFFFLAQPHAAQRVFRLIGRHLNAVVLVDGLPVGRAGPLRDPGPMAGSQDWFERGHQAAGRHHTFNPVRAPHVLIGLAI